MNNTEVYTIKALYTEKPVSTFKVKSSTLLGTESAEHGMIYHEGSSAGQVVISGVERIAEGIALCTKFDLQLLYTETAKLREENLRLRSEVKSLKAKSGINPEVRTRALTRRQAKDIARRMFQDRKHLSYSDLIMELGTDIRTTVKICRELEAEGIIREKITA